ncbi:MAG: OB-fold domain-containing protein, partial [Chloroflexi bacterium]|nr:OB-fold domain-containing protein [Chloroflexota bacterium]
RLVVQNCPACDRLQHPPQSRCTSCGATTLEWKAVSGRGTIYSYGVIYDTPIRLLQGDQPYNLAFIQLEEDPGIIFPSHLPGAPADEVPIGAPVRVIFETTPGTGQKVPEWQLVS